MSFAVGDKTISVAYKKHSIEHNRVINQQPQQNTAVLRRRRSATLLSQYNKYSLGGRGEVDFHYQKNMELSTTCSDVVIAFSAFS